MKNKSFRFLAVGQSLANAGDVFYIVALIPIVYNVSNSMFCVSLVPLTNMVSGSLSGILAPLIIDKYKLKKILLYSQFFKTFILFMLTLFATFDLTNQTIYFIFIMIFMISFLDGWANPASNAILPSLVSENQLVKANSLLSSLHQFIQMAGWAIGGVLTTLLHSNGLLFLTSTFYVLSTFMMAFLQDTNQKVEIAIKGDKFSSLVEGWKAIIGNASLRTLHLLIFFESIASPVWVSAILYPFIQQQLKVGTEWWGYINTSLLLGFFLAGIYGYKKSELLNRNMTFVILLGSFVVFVTTTLFGLNSVPWVSLLLIGIYGVFHELESISIHTLIQSIVQDQLLAKVYSAESTLIMVTFGIATLGMGSIGEHFNSRFVFLTASFFLCLSFFFTFIMKRHISIRNKNKSNLDI